MTIRFRSLAACLAVGLFALLVQGCSGHGPTSGADSVERPAWPSLPQDRPGQRVYAVDRGSSWLRLHVRPDGTLARFGHEHLIGGAVIDGSLRVADRAHADLVVDVGAMEVDRVEWRHDAGLEPLDPEAVEGTRRNLLGPRVLDAERFPVIEIRGVTALDVGSVLELGTRPALEIDARVRVRGLVTAVRFPIEARMEDEGLVLTGGFDVEQTALGMEPFSAAGGALRVADRLRVDFQLVARPVAQPVGEDGPDDVAMMRGRTPRTTEQ